jgi:hypothetical protein
MRALFLIILILPSLAASQGLLDDRANMKVLKVRSQMLLLTEDSLTNENPNAQFTGSDGLIQQQIQTGCGTLAIGNQATENTLSGDINVIIAGDVINTGNKCSQF